VWWVVGGASGFLALALSVPFLRGLFHFSPPHLLDLIVAVVGGVVAVLWFELLKVNRHGNALRP